MIELSAPIVPVIEIEDSENAVPLAEALLAGGLDVIEITFRTASAADSISRICKALPEFKTGAGTVVTLDQAKAAIDSGAQFGLAPGLDPETVEFFNAAGVPFIPGVMTPSGIQQALKLDCRYLKFFPAEAAGGVKMLKSMSAPYANAGLKFCPTGGLNLDNMHSYLNLSQVFAIGGSWLATQQDIAAKDWAGITAKVKAALAAV